MKLRADLSQEESVNSHEIEWVASPTPGVCRRMLERDGEEVARATTIVRFAAGMKFPPHTHHMGEEFLVIEGVFSDENGDYPVGSYLRHTWGSKHAPFSMDGCIILVKLRQMHPQDPYVHIDTNNQALWIPADEYRPANVKRVSLFKSTATTEVVEMLRCTKSPEPQSWHSISTSGGLEIFVVQGIFIIKDHIYKSGHWLRFPHHETNSVVFASDSDCTLWIKTGHLKEINMPCQ